MAGCSVGRSKPESITLLKSFGLAIEDVALGAKLLQLARKQGVGKELAI